MDRGLLGLPWAVWAAGAFTLAVVYSFVVPLASVSHGLERVVLRRFHALVWFLLGLSALTRGYVDDATGLGDALAGTALALYLIYVVTLTRARHRSVDRPP